MLTKVLVFVMCIISIFGHSASQNVVYAQTNLTDKPVIILSGKISDETTITIDAILKKNTGISGLLLEIKYDTKVMTLTNITQGEALSSLDYLPTNSDTAKGYAITPFKINYLGDDNDFSEGKMFTMRFTLKSGIANGTHSIKLDYVKNRDVVYIDEKGSVQTKNLLIDNAEVTIKDNKATQIEILEEKEPKNVWLVVGIVVFVVSISVSTVLVLLTKKRTKWKRL